MPRVVLLGRVALVAQRPIVVKLSRGRSLGPCVRASVGLYSASSKNGGSDPDPVLHHRSDRSRDEAGSEVGLGIGPQQGVFWGVNLGPAIVTNGDYGACV